MKKILGMGNALMDVLLRVSETQLANTHYEKGSMQLIDEDSSKETFELLATNTKTLAAGGSAANTVCGFARLGGEASFIGKVGHDVIAKTYKEDMIHQGVVPQLARSERYSGSCTVLVTPDGERTMLTYLGAASELSAEDISAEQFEGYDIFHIEGYLVQNHSLIEKALKLANAAGMEVSIDLASFNVVEENLDFLREMVKKYVNIVFANKDEARSFTGKESEEAVEEIAKLCDIAVVKLGRHGSLVRSQNETYKILPTVDVRVDTTGAGDLYAAGFLYGYATGNNLIYCGQLGSIISGKVVEVMGAKMPDETWEDIKAIL